MFLQKITVKMLRLRTKTILAVKAEQDDHDEEKNGPQRRSRKLRDSLRVCDEHQTGSCAKAMPAFIRLIYTYR